MKYCPECGVKITENPKFCPECGNKIHTDLKDSGVKQYTQYTDTHSNSLSIIYLTTGIFSIMIPIIIFIVTSLKPSGG